jgi:hypothetical protein
MAATSLSLLIGTPIGTRWTESVPRTCPQIGALSSWRSGSGVFAGVFNSPAGPTDLRLPPYPGGALQCQQRQQQSNKAAICSGFVVLREPSDGLEPSTPSLPWRFRGGTGGHGRTLAVTFFLQIECLRRVLSVRACPRVPNLMYPSRTRTTLSVCKTGDKPTARQPRRILHLRPDCPEWPRTQGTTLGGRRTAGHNRYMRRSTP